MCFSKEDCVYTKFNIENHKIDFADSGDGGVLISSRLWMIRHTALRIKLTTLFIRK